MFAKQLTVFIENRSGRLEEVLNVLKVNDINILALSLADTSEYGLLRLIVSDVELGKEKLKDSGFSTMVSDVLAVKLEHRAGSLQELLKYLSDGNVNVEYMYAISLNGNSASVALKVSDVNKAMDIISGKNVKVLTYEEILEFNKTK